MDRKLRAHRNLLRKNGHELSPRDERPDFLISMSNLPWNKIGVIAAAIVLGSFTIFGVSRCTNYIDGNHRKFIENHMSDQDALFRTPSRDWQARTR